MINPALYSSESSEWETPTELFNQLNAEFKGFECDVAATQFNTKCAAYYTQEIDGLKQEWLGKCWMNPPYGKSIGDWMKKAYLSSIFGAQIVALVPARTDTAWFHNWVLGKASEIRFIRGRLKFGNSKNSAPFPSMLCIYKREENASTQPSLYPVSRITQCVQVGASSSNDRAN